MKDSTRAMIERSRIDREFYPAARRSFVLARLQERYEKNVVVKPMRKFEVKMMRVKEVAEKLSEQNILTRENLVRETGFPLCVVDHIITRLKNENNWNYKYDSYHIAENIRNRDSVMTRLTQVIADNPHIQTRELIEMFKEKNSNYNSMRELTRLARKRVGVNIRTLNKQKTYENIIKLANENLNPDGSVNVKKISRIMGKSYNHVREYVREMKKKNLWNYPAHSHGKGSVGNRSDYRYQVHQLMVAKPTIGAKEVCERLQLDYLSNHNRIYQMMLRIERVDKVGWIGPRGKK